MRSRSLLLATCYYGAIISPLFSEAATKRRRKTKEFIVQDVELEDGLTITKTTTDQHSNSIKDATKPTATYNSVGGEIEKEMSAAWSDEMTDLSNEAFQRFLYNLYVSSTSVPVATLAPTTQPPTNPPTLRPTRDCDQPRRQYLINLFSQISDSSDIFDASSPQGRAINWILDEDPLQIDPCDYPTIEQRYALATFYFSTNGPNWRQSLSWLSGQAECNWFGVQCSDNVNLSALRLSSNSLAGTIPNEIGLFPQAAHFDFFGNSLTGTIPATVRQLTSMTIFDIERNQLSGSPFVDLTQVPSLKDLRVSSNLFTGTIPPAIGTLPRLEELWFANNRLTGTIPTEIGNLHRLQSFYLYNNQIGGNIPSDIGRLDLTELQAFQNSLGGTIPEELWDNVRLRVLRLDTNRLGGTISQRVGNLVNLNDLRLHNNSFTGTIPLRLLRLSSLEFLLLSNNQLGGTIRDAFQSFTRLDFLDLARNQFTGTLPSTLFNLERLRILYFADNNLEGTIPQNFDNAVRLKDLYLNGNYLSGTVPEIDTSSFRNLTELLLSGNLLTGSMPASICQLRSNGILEDLWADCQGRTPELICDVPACCTQCFDNDGRRRRKRYGVYHRHGMLGE